MLTSITPLGERGRASRWSVTVTAYLIGSVAGGAALGLLAGTAGGLLPVSRPGALAVAAPVTALAATLALLVELGRLPAPPSLRRQVDEDWLHRYRGWVYGLGYGVQLGFGLATIVATASLYVVLLLAALTGSAGAGALVGAGFGAARALPVLLLHDVHTSGRLTAVARRVESRASTARRAVATAMGLLAVSWLVALAGGAA